MPIVLVVGALMCSCSAGNSSPHSAAPATSEPTAGSSPAKTDGCGSPAQTGSTTESFVVGGRSRTVIVHVPEGYSADAKVPLVLNMHGSGSTASEQELLTGMDATSDAEGFIVAYPQGFIVSGTGYDWNVPGEPLVGGKAVPRDAPNDVAFLTDLVGVLEEHYCIDARRVYATGFSGGARIASQLGCDSSQTFAAIAPVSGLRRPTPCPTTRPVPVVAFHGTADPVDPYDGHGEGYWTYSVPQAARYWAQQDGCALSPVVSRPAAGASLTQYANCGGGSSVELYSISGEGHEWPGGPTLPKKLTRRLGPQSSAIAANEVMWSFFSAHPLTP